MTTKFKTASVLLYPGDRGGWSGIGFYGDRWPRGAHLLRHGERWAPQQPEAEVHLVTEFCNWSFNVLAPFYKIKNEWKINNQKTNTPPTHKIEIVKILICFYACQED